MDAQYPRHPAYVPHAAYGRPGFESPVIVPTGGTGPKPEAIIRSARPGSRVTKDPVTLLVATDHSGSTESTDADNARIYDLIRSMKWATTNLRSSDRIVLIDFTDEAAATGPISPNQAYEAAKSGQPGAAGNGGTAYLPIAAQALPSINDMTHARLLVVTDGMSGDVAQFASAVQAAGLKTTLVPFGQDWPFIKADWEHREHIRLATHVSDQPLAIARAITLTAFELTGQKPMPSLRSGRRARKTRSSKKSQEVAR